MSTLKVMVVEEHIIMLAGLQALLDREPDLAVVAAEFSPKRALSRLRESDFTPRLVVLGLPQKASIWMTRQIQAVRPEVPILMIVRGPEDSVLREALEAGASGYLTVCASHEELVQAVRAVGAGSSYIQPKIASLVLEQLRFPYHDGGNGPDSLSERERQVLKLTAQGLRNTEIAHSLSLSLSTVKSHTRSLYRKLGVSDRTQAVLVALQRRLIDEPRLEPSR